MKLPVTPPYNNDSYAVSCRKAQAREAFRKRQPRLTLVFSSGEADSRNIGRELSCEEQPRTCALASQRYREAYD